MIWEGRVEKVERGEPWACYEYIDGHLTSKAPLDPIREKEGEQEVF